MPPPVSEVLVGGGGLTIADESPPAAELVGGTEGVSCVSPESELVGGDCCKTKEDGSPLSWNSDRTAGYIIQMLHSFAVAYNRE